MGREKVTLVRVFCFLDGHDVTSQPIQKSPGVYDEEGLKRGDLIMQQAYLNDVRVIVVPTNYEPVGGGIQWYVDQVRTSLPLCACNIFLGETHENVGFTLCMCLGVISLGPQGPEDLPWHASLLAAALLDIDMQRDAIKLLWGFSGSGFWALCLHAPDHECMLGFWCCGVLPHACMCV